MLTNGLLIGTLFILVAVTESHKGYQMDIPNGNVVPDPCHPGGTWQGVGHTEPQGGGLRNKFGEDFAKEGHMWTHALCIMDSDGDGVTNGAELGDPNCQWHKDQVQPAHAVRSHPGICQRSDDRCPAASVVNCQTSIIG